MNISAAKSGLSCIALLGALVSAIPSVHADDAIVLDPALKGYLKVSGISGNVNSIGSDTLNNLMTLWAEGFRKQYPSVKIQIEGKGSSTAPPALIEGTAQLGPMSRAMKNTEIDSFERKFRYKPTAFPVAIDALAVYVNKDNYCPRPHDGTSRCDLLEDPPIWCIANPRTVGSAGDYGRSGGISDQHLWP